MKKLAFEDKVITISDDQITKTGIDRVSSHIIQAPYSITSEDLRERLNHPETGTKWPQFYCCFVVSMGNLSFGTTIGWAVPVLYNASSKDALHAELYGSALTWMSCIVSLGFCFGFGFWSLTSAKKGPRRTLLLQSPLLFLMWLIMIRWANPTIVSWGRFFLGFFGISYVVCGQTLLSDCVHKNLYQYLRIVPQTFVLIGVLLVQSAGTVALDWSVAYCASIPLIVDLLLLPMPESPVYKYKKGENFAENSLRWYQGVKCISESMRLIRNDYAYRRMNLDQHKDIIYSNVVLRAMAIILGVIIFQVITGYHMFLFYGLILFTKAPIISAIADVSILGAMLIAFKLYWMIFHFKQNSPVRKYLILSCILVATSLAFLALICFLQERILPESLGYLNWLAFVSCGFNIFGYEMGLSYFPPVLMYEYLPFQVYKSVLTILYTIFWFLIFITMVCYGLWHSYLDNWILIMICSITLYIGAIFVYYFVVEVKDRSLLQIQIEIGGNPVGNRASTYLRTGPND